MDNDEVRDNDGNDLFSGFCMLFACFLFRIYDFFSNFLIPLCLLSGHWPYASSLLTCFVHFLNLFRPSGYLAEAACHQACKSNRGFWFFSRYNLGAYRLWWLLLRDLLFLVCPSRLKFGVDRFVSLLTLIPLYTQVVQATPPPRWNNKNCFWQLGWKLNIRVPGMFTFILSFLPQACQGISPIGPCPGPRGTCRLHVPQIYPV